MTPSRTAALVVLVLLAGCGPRGEPPRALLGTWRSDVPPASLEIRPRSFVLASGNLTKAGTFQRTPFRVAFVLTRTSSPAFKLYCRETVDVYDWHLEGGVLRFAAVGRTCDRAARAVLVAARWRPEG